jgi:hypothetical protein
MQLLDEHDVRNHFLTGLGLEMNFVTGQPKLP